jgi:ferredoxin
MANLNDRIPDNVAGRYYVDANCIDCEQCQTTAPTLFARNSEKGSSFVQRQPSSPHELELAEEVLESCPNQAIGNDGA